MIYKWRVWYTKRAIYYSDGTGLIEIKHDLLEYRSLRFPPDYIRIGQDYR
jgi:hypothetical protein